MMPSRWLKRWADLIPRGRRVLDVACGAARHAIFLARRGYQVTAVDWALDASKAVAIRPRRRQRLAALKP